MVAAAPPRTCNQIVKIKHEKIINNIRMHNNNKIQNRFTHAQTDISYLNVYRVWDATCPRIGITAGSQGDTGQCYRRRKLELNPGVGFMAGVEKVVICVALCTIISKLGPPVGSIVPVLAIVNRRCSC